MKFQELKSEIRPYRTALIIETLVSGPTLLRRERFLRRATVVAFCCLFLLFSFGNIALFAVRAPTFSGISLVLLPVFGGMFGLLLSAWAVSFLLRSCYLSLYFQDLDFSLAESPPWKRSRVRYEVAAVVQRDGDALSDFFVSRFGFSVARRLGISAETIGGFLAMSRERVLWNTLAFEAGRDEPVSLSHLAAALVRGSSALIRFLEKNALTADDFVGAAAWVSRIEEQYRKYLRFWSRDAQGRIPGIGKNWAYGETPLLERYAVLMPRHPAFAASGDMQFGRREAEEVERILARRRESNALLLGEEAVPKLAVIAHLARRIIAGTVLPALEHKRIFVLDGGVFVSRFKERSAFEFELTRLLYEAARAGNIIFVCDHFDRFFEAARSLNSDVLTVLDPFLVSPHIQITAIAETGFFHQVLEGNPRVQERFERVFVGRGEGLTAMSDLLDAALRIEGEEGVFFTYGAVRAVAESAERYFPEGVMPDKAIDLLDELPPKVKSVGQRRITKEDVFELVSRKTGIAAGEVHGEEKAKLLRLEEALHERIVGQDEAIKTIAGALRRARAGVGNPNKPIGSFLFLGPTGVGKTETTKALAEAMFGDEKIMTRFDMSEFQTADALDRFIGAFGSGKAGVFASAIRERPYGVLLLDEFEKTNADIHHLFLQILDEGFFTDAKGARVNARNLMIVATSNAGSDLIWSQIRGADSPRERGTDAAAKLNKDAIIAEIVNRGIFKPELLNRFDGVILFHPLAEEHLRIIARLQLERLAKRLKEKGLELVISDALLDYLVSVGQDPKFGARPMNRAIQEKVEQKIADKLLRGEIFAGSRIELSVEDLS